MSGAAYILVQLLAGVFASALVSYQLDFSPYFFTLVQRPVFALIAELIFTFVLCFVVLRVATVPSNPYNPLAIGLCVVAGGSAAGKSLSCGLLNPAVTVGVLTAGIMKGSPDLIKGFVNYVLGQLLGGVLAAGIFMVVRSDKVTARELESSYQVMPDDA